MKTTTLLSRVLALSSAMAAANYFGEESGRLVRRYQRAVKVELGELKSLGIVEDAGLEKN